LEGKSIIIGSPEVAGHYVQCWPDIVSVPGRELRPYRPISSSGCKQYGIVKSTIIAPEICISFAGNDILHATKLFRELYDRRSFSRQDVVNLAYENHQKAPKNAIEYIVSSFENSKLQIDSVKESEICEDCASAWIGSKIAFDAFQEERHSTYPKGKPIHTYTAGAFSNVIDGCGDSSVGGFHIVVTYDSYNQTFCFQESKRLSALDQIVRPGESVVFDTSRESGGYSYEIMSPNIGCLLFVIDQMKSAVLFSRQHRCAEDSTNPNLFSLMLPMIVKQNENGSWMRCY
jgi:hypothetical protein